MTRIIFILALLMLTLPSLATADVKDGIEAYEQGDYHTASQILRPLAQRGDPEAQRYLGLMLCNGHGVKKNPQEAVRWFRRCAKQGDATCMYDMGLAYRKGYGVPRDYGQAVGWYRQAAELGHGSALFALGEMYDYGLGVESNQGIAHGWYRRAAEQGHPKAMVNLGAQFARGEGTVEDPVRAAMWFMLAEKKGRKAAEKNLAVMKERLSREQLEEARRRAEARESGQPGPPNIGEFESPRTAGGDRTAGTASGALATPPEGSKESMTKSEVKKRMADYFD